MRNPHSQYVVAVPGQDGTVTDWFIEWSDRNSLVRRGVDLDLIKPGDTVTLTLWPSQRLPNVGYFVQAVLADGSIYRDCGFVQYREAIVNSTKFRCEEGARNAPQTRRRNEDVVALTVCSCARSRAPRGRPARAPTRRRVAVLRRANPRGSRPHGGRPREARAIRSPARRHGHELQTRDVHEHHAHALPADRNPAAPGSLEINYEFMDVHRRVPLEGALASAPYTVADHPHMGRSIGRYEGEELVSTRSTSRPAISTRSGSRACRSRRRCARRSDSRRPAIASRWS